MRSQAHDARGAVGHNQALISSLSLPPTSLLPRLQFILVFLSSMVAAMVASLIMWKRHTAPVALKTGLERVDAVLDKANAVVRAPPAATATAVAVAAAAAAAATVAAPSALLQLLAQR